MIKRYKRSLGLVGSALAMCAALAAFGILSASSSANTSRKTLIATAAKAAKCGTVPNVPAKDPYHILANLPKSYKADYNGFGTVTKSDWSNWKPTGSKPYTVGILWPPPTSTFAETALTSIENTLKANPNIGNVVLLRTDTPVDVPEQLQQMNTLVQQKVNLIILSPLAPAPLAAAVTAAGQAGIPTISILNTTPSPYAVNVEFNPFLNAALPSAAVLKAMHGTGSLLEEIGIPGIQLTTDNEAVWTQLLSACPNVKVVNTLTTNFREATALSATLQFLATFPGAVNGVWEGGVVAPGIMQAFVQAGRPVPPVADEGAQQGSLAYWLQNKRSYTGAASGYPPDQYGAGIAQVALRMLLGQDVKTADIVQAPVEITAKNLNKWVSPAATITTPGDAVGPAGTAMSTQYLKPFFKHFKPIG
jgi:ribose transport system substrate-binding protein